MTSNYQCQVKKKDTIFIVFFFPLQRVLNNGSFHSVQVQKDLNLSSSMS